MAEQNKDGIGWRAVTATTITVIIIALAVQAILGIHWQTSAAFVALLIITEYILRQLEKDSAIKRFLRRSGQYILIIICYLGTRILFGYLFNAPIANTDEDLVKVGAKLVGYKDLSWAGNLVLEIAFILPGLVVATLLAKGGKWALPVYVLSIPAFLAVLWQAKQPEHTAAVKRNLQGAVALDARHQNNSGLTKEAAAASSYGIAKASITHFYRFDAEIGSFFVPEDLKGFTIPEGGTVLQPRPNEKGKELEGRYYVEVILPDENGEFLNGERVWVNPTEFNWVDGGNIISNKYAIVKSAGGKIWTVNFYTDEIINIKEYPVGQQIIITGAKQGEVFRPSSVNPGQLLPLPIGVEINNIKLASMELKYKKGGKIDIRFVEKS